ncbi:MAG: ribonuclease activity regulator RraA, partial [Rhodospirillaceae bacterium]|nr:ribonuclease activity regulator RraA [Rhodospirillaceae bacterium]
RQAIELNGPIGCGDVAVFPGDIIVGDQEGVVVIPLHMVDNVAHEATEMTAFEDFVTEQVHAGEAVIGLYPATSEKSQADFAEWRNRTGR